MLQRNPEVPHALAGLMPSLAFRSVPTRPQDARRPLRAICAAALLALILVPLLGAAAAHAGERQPNILIVTTDDQTLEEMNSTVMPYTSAFFADAGSTFENAVVVSPSCCPSRAAFLSGEYPHNNGVYSNEPGYVGLKKRASIIPSWLQNAGYRTAHFGKYLNHFQKIHPHGEEPVGWDRWFTSLNYKYFDYRVASDGRIKHYGERNRDYYTRRITDAATKYIGRYGKRKKPLYIQLDHFAPHAEQAETPGRCTEAAQPDPLDADAFLTTPLPQDGLDPATRSFNELDVSDKSPALARRRSLSEFVIGNVTKRYRCQLASLVGVDRSFEQVIASLHESGALRRTAIFFTSDNGFFFGEHRLPNNKGLPYEEGVRVPLLAHLPRSMTGDATAPATIPEPVGNIDLAPTFLDLAGGAPACNADDQCRRLDGLSLLSLLQGDSSGWPADRHLLIEQGRLQYFCSPYSGLWSPSELLVEYPTDIGDGACTIETEHYDMDTDPMQLQNLYPALRRQRHPARVSKSSLPSSPCSASAAASPGASGHFRTARSAASAAPSA